MNKERYLFQIDNGTPVMLDEAAISRKRDEFRRNTDYLESNYAELVKQYPNQWVAQFTKEVLWRLELHLRACKGSWTGKA